MGCISGDQRRSCKDEITIELWPHFQSVNPGGEGKHSGWNVNSMNSGNKTRKIWFDMHGVHVQELVKH